MTPRLAIRRAAQTLWDGGVIAYPTEAVFGFGCNPLDQAAVQRLLSIKRRALSKGLILIAASVDQLEPFIAPLEGDHLKAVNASWPGPVTWVVPAHPQTPVWLTGEHKTIAVRVTAHPTAAQLCTEANMAIVSTSANRSNRPPTTTRLATQLRFGLDVDYIVPGKVGNLKKPTLMKDLLTKKIIREG